MNYACESIGYSVHSSWSHSNTLVGWNRPTCLQDCHCSFTNIETSNSDHKRRVEARSQIFSNLRFWYSIKQRPQANLAWSELQSKFKNWLWRRDSPWQSWLLCQQNRSGNQTSYCERYYVTGMATKESVSYQDKWLANLIVFTYWLSGRAGQQNVWFVLMKYRLRTTRSAWPYLHIGLH